MHKLISPFRPPPALVFSTDRISTPSLFAEESAGNPDVSVRHLNYYYADRAMIEGLHPQ